MLKIMNHQLNSVQETTKELRERHEAQRRAMVQWELQDDLKENQIFKKYHEERLRRKKAEIEAGLICPEEDDLDLYLEGLTSEQIAEMKAKSELKEYQEAIKKRQEKFAMKDVA